VSTEDIRPQSPPHRGTPSGSCRAGHSWEAPGQQPHARFRAPTGLRLNSSSDAMAVVLEPDTRAAGLDRHRDRRLRAVAGVGRQVRQGGEPGRVVAYPAFGQQDAAGRPGCWPPSWGSRCAGCHRAQSLLPQRGVVVGVPTVRRPAQALTAHADEPPPSTRASGERHAVGDHHGRPAGQPAINALITDRDTVVGTHT